MHVPAFTLSIRPDNERRRRSARNPEEQVSHKSVKSGDMHGGFDSLRLPPPGNAQYDRQKPKKTVC